jgi:hypothetical protein
MPAPAPVSPNTTPLTLLPSYRPKFCGGGGSLGTTLSWMMALAFCVPIQPAGSDAVMSVSVLSWLRIRQ